MLNTECFQAGTNWLLQCFSNNCIILRCNIFTCHQYYFVLNFRKIWGDGEGGHWLVWMEWRPAGWSVCLPLLIYPCTIQSRSSLLAAAHPGGAGKRAVKWLCVRVLRVLNHRFKQTFKSW